jgi:hypothetical protein
MQPLVCAGHASALCAGGLSIAAVLNGYVSAVFRFGVSLQLPVVVRVWVCLCMTLVCVCLCFA